MVSTGVAHAGCNAIEGEQCTPKQLTAAVGACVFGRSRGFAHGRLPVLITQSLQQRNLEKAQGNDGAIAQINGLDLTDLQQSQEALSELRNSQTIELTIIRDGEYATIYLDLPEPELE